MPWLVHDEVYMVHVPRCGGTSISKHHQLPKQSRQGKNWYHSLGMMHYFYRYRLLEAANFPLVTIENLIVLIQITLGCLIFFFVGDHSPAPYWMWTSAVFTFTFSTIIFTAPVALRSDMCRRALLFTQNRIICGFGCDTRMMTGNSINGILIHFTAPRLIAHGYVTKEQIERCSFSIVRNPYSRVVSLYGYNRRMGESFHSYVESLYADYMTNYIGKGTCECWEVYCHVLPMHCYTHDGDEQLVQNIIKQEELGKFMKKSWKGTNVPKHIAHALTGIPHANSRKRKEPWHKYYDQRTMDLVLEMYYRDFLLYGYPLEVPHREDLSVNLDLITLPVEPGCSDIDIGIRAIIKRDLDEDVESDCDVPRTAKVHVSDASVDATHMRPSKSNYARLEDGQSSSSDEDHSPVTKSSRKGDKKVLLSKSNNSDSDSDEVLNRQISIDLGDETKRDLAQVRSAKDSPRITSLTIQLVNDL